MATIPSIAMIPSGYKAGKVYSVLPTNGDADLTFTRVGALPSYNATRVNENGLIEEVLSNVPRLDYFGGGCPSLLVEPQSRNLFTQSQNFISGDWVQSLATVSVATELSPSNDTTAYKLIPNSGTQASRILNTNFNIPTAGDITISIFVKKVDYDFFYFREDINNTIQNTFFNINSKTTITPPTGRTSSIEDYGNGWVRVSLTSNSPDTTISNIGFGFSDTSSSNVVTGDGIKYGLIWGAQLEALPYATSYIPTVASTVTRVAETVSKTGLSSYINSNEGALFVDLEYLTKTENTNKFISISDGSPANNYIQIRLINNTLTYRSFINGVGGVSISTSLTNLANKIALTWKNNNSQLWLNGVKINEDLISQTPNNLQSLFLSNENGGGAPLYGKIKNLQVFNTALSDAELQTLTSL